MKKLRFKSNNIEVEDPKLISFDSDFDLRIYQFIYDLIIDGDNYKPVLNSDDLSSSASSINLDALYDLSDLRVKPPSIKASSKDRLWCQHLVRDFLARYPVFAGLVCNNIILADIAIANAEILFGERVDESNFIEIKSVIDEINRCAWTREKDVSERQSGISTLGTISEELLRIIFEQLVDNKNFFKVDQSEVQSYGDFVLMCLPNNLWLSVKSNFARERLLASGYANDILGVGFFQDHTEFTSSVRIRNFQRGGFLAMYCPDVAVSESQINNETNTYDQVMEQYKINGQIPPTNINGMPFIRRLSSLSSDLSQLLEEQDVRKRSTVAF